ncbi:GH32 C-terminal domain-containing protein [Halalkalibacter lacteus]|uniref:GH32 C-terminal domain-containing protein n=1 Tax=Halalkalibacter lacteus TaxID=3090663 RepID=UPI002FC917A6
MKRYLVIFFIIVIALIIWFATSDSDDEQEQVEEEPLDESQDVDESLEDVAALWKFDEGTGTTTVEARTNQEHNIHYVFNEAADKPNSDPLWKQGISGHALLFDGYSTWVSADGSTLDIPKDALTLEAWVAPRAFEWGNEGKLSSIVSYHNQEENQGFHLGVFRHGTWSFQFGTGEEWLEVWAGEEFKLPRNEWSHLVAVFSQERNEVVLYRNGEQAGHLEVPPHTQVALPDQELRIGKNNDPAKISDTFDASMFNGLIDEVKLYQTALEPHIIVESFDQFFAEELPDPSSELAWDRSRYEGDRHRPQYHFTPPEHWMNEPHAPLYFNGQYHLFYQFNPAGPYWGGIHWGHAVSDDLIHWRDLPIALAPEADQVDPDGVWSGDSIIDDEGKPALFFTAGNDSMTPNQMTGLARSTFLDDHNYDLVDWIKHPEPVTIQEEHIQTEKGTVWHGQFRDPFVFKSGDKWVQLVGSGIKDGEESVGGTALVYTSDNLIDWHYEHPLMIGNVFNYPETGDVWELPVLLPIGENDSGEEKYVFLINPWFDGDSEYAVKYVWYWIGSWDDETYQFIPDQEDPQLLDVGEHFTGPSGMVDEEGRAIVFSIAQDRRTEESRYNAGWAHNAGLPIVLSLRDDHRLGVEPVQEVERLREEHLYALDTPSTIDDVNQQIADLSGDMLEIELEIERKEARKVGIKVRQSPDQEEETLLFYDFDEQMMNVDREHSSLSDNVEKGIQGGKVEFEDDLLRLRIFLDRSMVEAYINGVNSLTTRVYPSRDDSLYLELFTEGESEVKKMNVWRMGSAY